LAAGNLSFLILYSLFKDQAYEMGDRICLGQYLASDSVWIAMATLLATLKISKPLDDEGKEITPEPRMITGVER
jgi:cytochrome P450